MDKPVFSRCCIRFAVTFCVLCRDCSSCRSVVGGGERGLGKRQRRVESNALGGRDEPLQVDVEVDVGLVEYVDGLGAFGLLARQLALDSGALLVERLAHAALDELARYELSEYGAHVGGELLREEQLVVLVVVEAVADRYHRPHEQHEALLARRVEELATRAHQREHVVLALVLEQRLGQLELLVVVEQHVDGVEELLAVLAQALLLPIEHVRDLLARCGRVVFLWLLLLLLLLFLLIVVVDAY